MALKDDILRMRKAGVGISQCCALLHITREEFYMAIGESFHADRRTGVRKIAKPKPITIVQRRTDTAENDIERALNQFDADRRKLGNPFGDW